jgi:hypothetical protein
MVLCSDRQAAHSTVHVSEPDSGRSKGSTGIIVVVITVHIVTNGVMCALGYWYLSILCGCVLVSVEGSVCLLAG